MSSTRLSAFCRILDIFWRFSARHSPALQLRSLRVSPIRSAQFRLPRRTISMPENAKSFSYNVSHFDVQADDLSRARRFYETVFEWNFNPWGPPDFFLIATGKKDDPGIHGALTKRRTHVEGKPMFGYECTISVANVDETAAAIEANGGQVTLPKTCI